MLILGTQQFIDHLRSNYDHLINISGRQRMLSQKLAYLKTGVVNEQAFQNSLKLFKDSQKTLFVLNQAVSEFERESDFYGEINAIANIILTSFSLGLVLLLHFLILKPQQKSIIEGLEEYYQEKEKAKESSKIKSAFIANMTHELRTPMKSLTIY